VRLEVGLSGVDLATAERLVQTAHQVCPYSHAVKGNIDVAIELVSLS
jgi:organic hydroperoxide reductase OsmC/OhrA